MMASTSSTRKSIAESNSTIWKKGRGYGLALLLVFVANNVAFASAQ
jgi:hypothetical protein